MKSATSFRPLREGEERRQLGQNSRCLDRSGGQEQRHHLISNARSKTYDLGAEGVKEVEWE